MGSTRACASSCTAFMIPSQPTAIFGALPQGRDRPTDPRSRNASSPSRYLRQRQSRPGRRGAAAAAALERRARTSARGRRQRRRSVRSLVQSAECARRRRAGGRRLGSDDKPGTLADALITATGGCSTAPHRLDRPDAARTDSVNARGLDGATARGHRKRRAPRVVLWGAERVEGARARFASACRWAPREWSQCLCRASARTDRQLTARQPDERRASCPSSEHPCSAASAQPDGQQ